MSVSILQTEQMLVAVLVQLIVIVLAARLAGTAAAALRQPRAVGEIVAGLMLGPSFLGYFAPSVASAIFVPAAAQAMTVLSQIGLIFLMFQIGSDFEFAHLRKTANRKAVLWTALASVGAPLATGFILGWLSAPVLAPGIEALPYSFFFAIALAITAVPILGRILREYSLTRVEVGVIAISAAAANDVVGWMLLAATAAYASSAFSPTQSALQIAGLAALTAVLWLGGRPCAAWLVARYPIEGKQLPTTLMATVIALIFLAGIGTEKLGIFTIFGGFLVGLLFHRHHAFVEAWRVQIGQFVLVFFLPVFFTSTGLRTDVLGLTSASDWAWCAAIFVAAVVSKIAPVFVAARLTGINGHKSFILGVLMNTRGLMELIVLNVGFTLGLIPQTVFTMLVLMAIGTTIMTGPLLQFLLPRAGYRADAVVES